jgi:hypothetical protein
MPRDLAALILWCRTRSSALLLAATLFLVPLTAARDASGTISSALLGSFYTWAWFTLYFVGPVSQDQRQPLLVSETTR